MSAAKDLLLSAFLARRAGRMVRDTADARALTAPTQALTPSGATLTPWAWPRGQLIEVLVDTPGQTEIELCLPQLQADRNSETLWILPCSPRAVEHPLHPYANRLERAGLNARLQHVQQAANARATWCVLEHALRARQFSHVVAWISGGSHEGDYRVLRRLHALIAGSATRCILVRDPAAANWPSPARLRFQLEAGHGVASPGSVRARQITRWGQAPHALAQLAAPRTHA